MKNLKKFWLLGLFLGLLLLMNACYYDQYLPDTQDVGEMSFSGDIMVIFNASCNNASCHGGAVAPDLRLDNAYNALINGNYIDKANPGNSELIQWMKGEKGLSMPLSGPNPTYNAKVLAWINQGALNN